MIGDWVDAGWERDKGREKHTLRETVCVCVCVCVLSLIHI